MKGFVRKDPYLSLCGLNCKLCSMELGGHCGGCGFGNQSCAIARCGMEHSGVEYCVLAPFKNVIFRRNKTPFFAGSIQVYTALITDRLVGLKPVKS